MAAASHTLRIHHLDTGLSGGDATIIALWEEDSYGVAKTPLYVVLIDGGYFGSGNTSLTRAWKAYGLTDANKCADVIVATNYDANAISGVLALVKDAAGDHPSTPIVGNSTVFIDGGQPGSVAGDANQSVAQQVAGKTVQIPAYQVSNYSSQGTSFVHYRDAMVALKRAQNAPRMSYLWPTGLVARDALPGGANWRPANRLLANNGLSTGNGPTDLFAPFNQDNPSTVTPISFTVIAANGWVLDGNGTPQQTSVPSTAPEAGCSLGFYLQFGGFTYYHGGNLTTTQEGTGTATVLPSLSAYFSKMGTMNNSFRIGVARLAQQGGPAASATGFLTLLNPMAVVAACGWQNLIAPAPDLPIRASSAARYYTGAPTNIPTANLTVADMPAGYVVAKSALPAIPGDVTVTVRAAQATKTDQKQHFTVSYTGTVQSVNPRPMSDMYNP